jgi:hypothetical protein
MMNVHQLFLGKHLAHGTNMIRVRSAGGVRDQRNAPREAYAHVHHPLEARYSIEKDDMVQ